MSDSVEVKSVAELHAWLRDHHGEAESHWLVHYKNHTPYYVPFPEFVAELLCWGWVDSVTRSVDADRSAHLISPRKAKSAWSAVNKALVAELRCAGRMQPSGEAAIARAEANGMWSFLDDVERLEVPGDLAAALGQGRAVWDAYPRSVKRGTLEWLKTAKTAQTRDKRIAAIASAATKGQRPPLFQR